jgi:hypothetical protein
MVSIDRITPTVARRASCGPAPADGRILAAAVDQEGALRLRIATMRAIPASATL